MSTTTEQRLPVCRFAGRGLAKLITLWGGVWTCRKNLGFLLA